MNKVISYLVDTALVAGVVSLASAGVFIYQNAPDSSGAYLEAQKDNRIILGTRVTSYGELVLVTK